MLKVQYFGHLMQIADSFDKSLMLARLRAEREEGKIEGKRISG